VFTAVAFVPVAPVLVLGPPGAVEPVDAAVARALAPIAAAGLPVHLLVAAPEPGAAEFTFAGLGAVPDDLAGPAVGPDTADLPWRVGVAEALIGRHGLRSGQVQQLRPGAALDEPEQPACLVVAADGSAKRSDSAPGSFDPRAEAFDAAVLAAVGEADPVRLADLDAGLGTQLLADGVHVWRAVGTALRGRGWRVAVAAELNAPFGVGYLTGAWVREGSRR
jgi:hypothetical protein